MLLWDFELFSVLLCYIQHHPHALFVGPRFFQLFPMNFVFTSTVNLLCVERRFISFWSQFCLEMHQYLPLLYNLHKVLTVKCTVGRYRCRISINPLNPELNPICYLLALLGAHHFLHISRLRVKLLTFRRLSYIYGAPILDVSRSHTTTQHSR